jgi:predicted nucleic acid-binding protein
VSLSLLDSNVWVSLAIDRHAHHRDAVAWFNQVSSPQKSHTLRIDAPIAG